MPAPPASNSPLLFGYLPRLHHEELRQAIASHVAAQETLDAHGPAATPEAIEARKAVETHLEVARHRIQELLGHVIGGAKVFLGGGQEANGIELADKVQDSANSALERLFPQFSEADHANWGQVVTRARAGDVGALSQVGYPGDVTKHPVCRRVLDLIGAGKKGKDIREHFRSAPFGWPQDAIDGALFVMLVAGNLRATINGQPAQAQTLPQNQVGVASFYVDVPPLNVQQRLDLKALFQKIGVTTQNGKESEAAAQFLQKLLALAESAGGSAPRPESPDTQDVRALQMLSGNAQLLKIHEQKDDLTAKLAAWKKNADAIAKRWPAWERLLDFHSFATGLPEAEACAKSIAAITDGRTLLADPDPVPELTKQLTTALRIALGKLQDDLAAAFKAGDDKARRLASVEPPERRTARHARRYLPAHAAGERDHRHGRRNPRRPARQHPGRPAQPARRRAPAVLPRAGRGQPPAGTQGPARGAARRDHPQRYRTGPVARRRSQAGGGKTQRRPRDSMSTLPTNLRRQLESAIKQARKIAEGGARKALEALAVHEPDPYRHMDEAQRDLRRKLRAQAKQLGDGESQTRRGAYEIKHLVEKLAYDQWHRLLFARFLLENNLLISPEHGVSVSLDDCEELAPSLGLKDAWAVAARFAAKELPEIFRADDPAGAVELPVEDRKPLIQLVTGLPVEVFTASDSLGWCYQFWQAERKDRGQRRRQQDRRG